MRTLPAAILALILLPAGFRAADAEEEFGPEQAKALIPEAAGIPRQAAETVKALGAAVSVEDLNSAYGSPLTLVVMALSALPRTGDAVTDVLRDADFRSPALGAVLTPSDIAEAALGEGLGKPAGTRPYASLILPEYVKDLTFERQGDAARGTVTFSAPKGVYAGRVEWVARKAAAGWRIEEFRLPGHRVRVVLSGWKWKAEDEARPGKPWRRPPEGSYWVPTGLLPRVGTLADVPAKAVTIAVSAEGRIWCRGRAGDLAVVRDALGDLRKDARLLDLDGSLRIDVVVRVPARLPWEVLAWVLQECAVPPQRAWRFHFSVLPEEGSEEGALPWFAPRESRLTGVVAPTIRLAPDSAAPAAEVEYAAYRRLVDASPEGAVAIAAAPGSAAGLVIRAYDLLLRAGAKAVVFVGAPVALPPLKPPYATEIEQYVASNPSAPGISIRIGGATIRSDTSPTEALTPPRLARGAIPPAATEAVALASEPEPSTGDVYTHVQVHGRFFRGGPKEPPAHVVAALAWLAAHQSSDGRWEAEGFDGWCDREKAAGQDPRGHGKAQYDVGVTGLALLAFLGAGYTHRSEGPYGRVVGDGLRWLKNVQDAEGGFGSRASGHFVYNQAIAAWAMVEAYCVTGSVIYKGPAQRGLDFAAIARNPRAAWRYGIQPGDNDTSITGWMTMALEAGRVCNHAVLTAGMPAPFSVDEDAFGCALAWVDKVTDPATGRVGYQVRGLGPARPTELRERFPPERSEAMTAAGILIRMLEGQAVESSPAVAKGARLLAGLPPRWDEKDGSIDMQYWLFGTLAMRRVGGDAWKAWSEAARAAVLPHQRTDGDVCGAKGSWDPVDPWGPDGGRVYSTAMLCLVCEALEGYERVVGPRPH